MAMKEELDSDVKYEKDIEYENDIKFENEDEFWEKDLITLFVYKCKECQKRFFEVDDLWTHMKSIHEEDASIGKNTEVYKYSLTDIREFSLEECDYCQIVLLGAEQMNIHKNTEHQEHLLHCHDCEFNTFQQNSLQIHQHQTNHKRKRKRKLNDGQVKKEFNKLKKETTSPKEYKCDECEFTARRLSTIRKHWQALHRVKYKCEFCDFKTKAKSTLKMHKKSVHNVVDDESVTCEQCGWVAKCKSKLTWHIKRAHEGLVFTCPQCDTTFTSKFHMKNHIASKHGSKDLLCDKCDYRAATKVRMKLHVQSKHTGISYQCPYCSHQSPFSGDLNKHIKFVHEGIRFPCSMCSFVSTRRIEVKRHLKKVHDLADDIIDMINIEEVKMDQFIKKKEVGGDD